MKKLKSFLMSMILILTLFVGVSIYNKANINVGNEAKRNIFRVNTLKAYELKEKQKLAEDTISNLPSYNNIKLEDQILLDIANKSIKDVRDLDTAIIIEDEDIVRILEKRLTSLKQAERKERQLANESAAKEKKQAEAEKQKKLVEAAKPKAAVITYKDVVDYQAIGFETNYVNDSSMAKGFSSVQTNGVNGERKIVTRIKYADNIHTSSEVISNTVTVNPVNQVIRVGTQVEYIDNTGQTGAMLNEINNSRSQSGLGSLQRSSRLDAAASVRVKEIITNFSHTRPNGTLFNTVDVEIISGENIAYGSIDPLVTHGRFMASQGHKDNILRGDFRSVGLSSYKGSSGPTYWVVLFSRY